MNPFAQQHTTRKKNKKNQVFGICLRTKNRNFIFSKIFEWDCLTDRVFFIFILIEIFVLSIIFQAKQQIQPCPDVCSQPCMKLSFRKEKTRCLRRLKYFKIKNLYIPVNFEHSAPKCDFGSKMVILAGEIGQFQVQILCLVCAHKMRQFIF